MKSMSIGTKLEVSDIELEETFKCTGMELFNALTQPEMIQVFTQNPVKMDSDAKAGVEFTLLSGSINGTFITVTPYTKICQSWQLWPPSRINQLVPKKSSHKHLLKETLKALFSQPNIDKDMIHHRANKL